MNDHTAFDTPRPVTLTLELSAGEVILEATDTPTTSVDLNPMDASAEAQALVDEARVEQRGDDILVLVPRPPFRWGRPPRVRARVTLPTDSALTVSTDSADVRVSGRVDQARITAASGDVTLDEAAGSVVAKTASGDVSLRRSGGASTVTTASGDVRIGDASARLRVDTASGDVQVGAIAGAGALTTASGDISVGESGDLHCRAASGDITLQAVTAGSVSAATASGDVTIGLRDGSAAWLDVFSVSGRVRSSLESLEAPPEGGPRVELRVRTTSGDVHLHRC